MKESSTRRRGARLALLEGVLELNPDTAVGYAIYGSWPAERVAFYFHGLPGSRIEASFLHRDAARLNIGIVALERPGYGRSANIPSRKIADWPGIVAAAADHFKVDKFSVIGMSGGGPYAAACGHALAGRVESVMLLSSMAPLHLGRGVEQMISQNRILLALPRIAPRIGSALLKLVGGIWSISPGITRRWLRLILHQSDRSIIGSPDIAPILETNLREAFSSGVKGAVRDIELLAQPWGFDLAEIRSRVEIWHGDADDYVPLHMGETLRKEISGASLRVLPKGGHFVMLRHVADVLQSI